MFPPPNGYISSRDIIRRYSYLVREFNWTEQTPDHLLTIHFVQGTYQKEREITLIEHSSFWRFLEEFQRWMEAAKTSMFTRKEEELLTACEILEDYSYLRSDFNWTQKTPGQLLSISVLGGKFQKGRHQPYFTRSSLEKRVIPFYLKMLGEKSSRLEKGPRNPQ